MRPDHNSIADDQVRSAFQRWKNLEEEKARIGDDLKELFAEQKGHGHDTKAMRAAFRLKVKMDEARPEDAEHEALVDTYLAALEAPRASRAYARESIEQSHVNPQLIKQVVDGMQTDAGRAALIAAVDIMIEREEAEEFEASDGSPSVSSSLTTREAEESVVPHSPVTAEELQHPVPHATGANARSGGDGSTVRGARTEADAVTAGETAPSFQSDDGAIAAVNGKAGLANADGVEPPSSGHLEVPSAEREDCAAANTALPANGITIEYCPPTGVKRSSFAHCFPEPSKEQRAALERDIIDNRVQVPIIRQGNVILDGWARYTIARSLGQNYPVKAYDGDDALLDVIEWQRAARNFTPAQEKKIAADLAKELPHRADDIMAAFGLAEALEAAE